MAELKTKPRTASVAGFIAKVAGEERRADCTKLVEIMKAITRAEPRMWGPSIVGFGDWHYVSDSGREGDWFITGFSPRKQDLSLYLMGGLDIHAEKLARLGKHKRGKGCLYLKRLADVDLAVLKAMIRESVKHMKAKKA